MTVNYTTLLRLVQPVTGTESGTWGDYVNNALTAYLDVAVAGTQTLSTDANATLTLTDGTNSGTNLGSTSAQYAIINMTGARTQTRAVTLPSSSRNYVVLNNTTGGYAMTVGGVSVAAGERCILTYDTSASAYVKTATNSVSNATGTLPVGNGGTGATSLTLNNVILGNGTSAVQTVGPGASGNVLTSNGTTWTSAAPAVIGARSQIFTSSGTFTVPTGVTAVKVTVVGGGGMGSSVSNYQAGGGGGGGGAAVEWITGLTPAGTVTVTVGAGGTTGSTTGGTSSFGSYVSASGGSGGTAGAPGSGGAGGTGGSGGQTGDLNADGASGSNGVGGGCCVPTGGRGGIPALTMAALSYGYGGAGGATLANGSAGTGYGGGGGGAAVNTNQSRTGGNGAPGVVIVEW
jgi:hypothetical protein